MSVLVAPTGPPWVISATGSNTCTALMTAITALTAVIHELVAARRADREVLQRILDACTREASGELQEAIRQMATAIATMGGDVRAILAAVGPRPPPR